MVPSSPMKESALMNKSKFCHFHKSHEHNNDDYVYLKDVIE